MLEDAYLLKELQKGNHHAFKTLYERYWEHLYAVAYHWLGAKEEAQEIVQEVFVELWEKRTALNIKKSFSSYLFAVTKYKVFDCIDARAVRKNYLSQVQRSSSAGTYGTENTLVFKETQQRIADALEKLPVKTQQIFSLSREQELPYTKIAKMMNMSVKSVEYHITKTLKYLRLIIRSLVFLIFFDLL